MAEFTDIEREIEARWILGLRRVFEFDTQFKYNKIDSKTKIIISPDFPEKDAQFKIPQIVVTGIAFQNNTQMTFGNNFFSDIPRNGIVNYASASFAQIPYSATLICIGEYDISRNLANRAFFYTNFRAYEYLSDSLRLNIQGVSKGPSSPKEQYPEHIFQTPVSVQGSMNIEVVRTPFNYLQGNESLPVDKKGQSFKKAKISMTINDKK